MYEPAEESKDRRQTEFRQQVELEPLESHPVEVFLKYLLANDGKGDPISVKMRADGKNFNHEGKAGYISDFRDFGTQSDMPYSFIQFKWFFGDHVGDLYKDKTNRDQVSFLGEKKSYPAVAVIRRKGEGVVKVGTTRRLNEADYLRKIVDDIGNAINRPFFDQRLFEIEVGDLGKLPFHISLARLQIVHELPITEQMNPQPQVNLSELSLELSSNSLTPTYENFLENIKSEIFNVSEKFLRLFSFVLLQIQVGQPIFLEQTWSLSEKTVFIQMLQDFMSFSGNEKIINWSSEPIVTCDRPMNIVFRQPGEGMVDSDDEYWERYEVVSEDKVGLSAGETRYANRLVEIFNAVSEGDWKDLGALLVKEDVLDEEIAKVTDRDMPEPDVVVDDIIPEVSLVSIPVHEETPLEIVPEAESTEERTPTVPLPVEYVNKPNVRQELDQQIQDELTERMSLLDEYFMYKTDSYREFRLNEFNISFIDFALPRGKTEITTEDKIVLDGIYMDAFRAHQAQNAKSYSFELGISASAQFLADILWSEFGFSELNVESNFHNSIFKYLDGNFVTVKKGDDEHDEAIEINTLGFIAVIDVIRSFVWARERWSQTWDAKIIDKMFVQGLQERINNPAASIIRFLEGKSLNRSEKRASDLFRSTLAGIKLKEPVKQAIREHFEGFDVDDKVGYLQAWTRFMSHYRKVNWFVNA